MPGNWLNRLVFTILLSGSLNPSMLLIANTCDEENESSPDGQSESALGISISDVEASLVIGQEAREFTMRLIIAVNVESRSDDAITLAREQFQLLVDGEPAEIGSVDSHPSFQRSTLRPGKSADGWIGFGSIVYDGHEPSIVLRWRPPTGNSTDSRPVDVDLNAELRQQSGFQQTRLGPEGCLLQITTNRDLDVLAIWSVESMLKTAAAEKSDAYCFRRHIEQPPVIHEEFNLWLSGMIDTSTSVNDPNLRFMPRVNPPFPRSGIRFQQITVGGLKEAMNHKFGMYRHPIAVLSSAEAAVADALTPVYRHVVTELAVADLQHPNPGVRRAARAGVVDRLTPEQASTCDRGSVAWFSGTAN